MSTTRPHPEYDVFPKRAPHPLSSSFSSAVSTSSKCFPHSLWAAEKLSTRTYTTMEAAKFVAREWRYFLTYQKVAVQHFHHIFTFYDSIAMNGYEKLFFLAFFISFSARAFPLFLCFCRFIFHFAPPSPPLVADIVVIFGAAVNRTDENKTCKNFHPLFSCSEPYFVRWRHNWSFWGRGTMRKSSELKLFLSWRRWRQGNEGDRRKTPSRQVRTQEKKSFKFCLFVTHTFDNLIHHIWANWNCRFVVDSGRSFLLFLIHFDIS